MIPSFDQIIKSIEQLPAAEHQGFVSGWNIGKRRTEKDTSHKHTLNRSAKSLKWLHENRQKYSGHWITLEAIA